MTPEELRRDLALAGIAARVRGAEVQVEVCRYCGNARWNLELSAPLGVYHCWACRASGRLDGLLRDLLGAPYRIPVRAGRARDGVGVAGPAPPAPTFQQTPAADLVSARRYLARRGIDEATARAFGLAVCTEPGHLLEGRITVPALDYWTGVVLGHWGRAYTPTRRPKYLGTYPRRTVFGWRARARGAPCVVVEGPFDGLAVARAGLSAAVLSGVDAGDVEMFAARLAPDTPLVVMLDAAARDESRRLLARIRPIRPAVEADLPDGTDPAIFAPATLARYVRALLAHRGGRCDPAPG